MKIVMHRTAALFWLACVSVAAESGAMVGPTHDVPPVAVAVYPQLSHKGTAHVIVQVEPNDLNRKLDCEIEGEAYFRRSSLQLDGASSPRSWTFVVTDLPQGRYDARAIVARSDGSESSATASFSITSGSKSSTDIPGGTQGEYQ